MKMVNKKFILLGSVVGLSLLAFIYSRSDIRSIIRNYGSFRPALLLLYAGVVLLMDLIMTLRWSVILNAYGINVRFWKLFLYNMAGFAAGFLISNIYIGSEPVRAMLLERDHVHFKKALSTGLVDKSMQITTDFLFITLGIFLLLYHFSFSKDTTALILLAIFAAGAFGFAFYSSMTRRKPFLSRVFHAWPLSRFRKLGDSANEVESTMQEFFVHHKRLFPVIFLINTVLMLFVLIEYALVVMLFGIKLSLFSVLLVNLGVGLSYSLAVPLALGTLEAAQVAVARFLGIDKTIGLSISLFIRLKDIIRALFGIAGLFYLGVRWREVRKVQDRRQKPQAKSGS